MLTLCGVHPDVDPKPSSIDRFDTAADTAADRIRGKKTIDRLFYTLTEAANHSFLWHAITLAMVIGRQQKLTLRSFQVTVLLGVESALVNGPIKHSFKRERPVQESHPHRLRSPKTSSFPSGHATSGFCAAVLLAHNSPTATRRVLYLLASLVAYSRVHVRIHHASDVVGGAMIGVLLGKIGKRFLR